MHANGYACCYGTLTPSRVREGLLHPPVLFDARGRHVFILLAVKPWSYRTHSFHLRTRNLPPSFSTLERKRQDGPSTALLESPQKVRPGIPILVSQTHAVSSSKIASMSSQFHGFMYFPTVKYLGVNVNHMGSGARANMAAYMR